MGADTVVVRDRSSEGAATPDPSVVIVGAGPTGLALAIELARREVTCRVVDRSPEWLSLIHI